jgi:predicted small secreted protein
MAQGIGGWHMPCKALPGSKGFSLANMKGSDMKAIAAIVMAAVLGMLAGCNTVEGAGKDVKATGRAVERAADSAKPN